MGVLFASWGVLNAVLLSFFMVSTLLVSTKKPGTNFVVFSIGAINVSAIVWIILTLINFS